MFAIYHNLKLVWTTLYIVVNDLIGIRSSWLGNNRWMNLCFSVIVYNFSYQKTIRFSSALHQQWVSVQCSVSTVYSSNLQCLLLMFLLSFWFYVTSTFNFSSDILNSRSHCFSFCPRQWDTWRNVRVERALSSLWKTSVTKWM